ncbi:MAG: hypothetical protein OXL68_21890 [Paracoccaceae bacterium]|nr:hypothetical protein [Paracoccaceae bacterium]
MRGKTGGRSPGSPVGSQPAGDRIRWTRNDAGLGLVNSLTADVAAVRDSRIGFRLEDGRMLEMNAGDPEFRHIDHAWISTVHAFQGCMVENVIAAIEANHPNLTNQKVPYVEIGRTRDRAELVTNDKAALGEDRARASETRAGRDVGASRNGPQPGTGRGKEPEPKTPGRDLGL